MFSKDTKKMKCNKELINKSTNFTLNCQSLNFRSLHVPNNLTINIELLGNGNHLIGSLFISVDLQTVAHVEDFVHLVPVGAEAA